MTKGAKQRKRITAGVQTVGAWRGRFMAAP